jgi:DoxX-like family
MPDKFFIDGCRFGRTPFDIPVEVNKMQVHSVDLELTQTGVEAMPNERVVASKKMLWAGRVISGLLTVMLLMDGMVKVLKLAPAVEGTVRLGYPVIVLVPIGLALLGCLALYLVPRTCILGAILLTGFFGGATATQVRMQDPWFALPVVLGMLVWLGVYLRDERLRLLLPLRKEGGSRG